ncbi:MAG: phosphoribosylformylglycinamidine synthase subunit PurQ [Rhodospirillales bacterium]|nr:phosphoribosylformylglycinamidine synthase subunit PurQ [Rhodospirillales bacterium]
MRAGVVVFPGSNCDRDIAVALDHAIGRPPMMIWHGDTEIPPLDLIVVPGGFAFGDYLRAGAIAAHSPVMREVRARANAGVLVLGICNGFQVLTEAGLLEGILLRNDGLRFICRDVFLRVETTKTPFTSAYTVGQVVRMPIAHNEGNYFTDPSSLDRLADEDRIAFVYCDQTGQTSEASNPNGSQRNIAGIVNKRGNVLGLMPHPERLADPQLGGTDGRILFEGLLTAAAR